MKKRIVSLFFLLMLFVTICIPAFAADDNWAEAPIITHVYEYSKGKLFVEWEGNSILYQVYLDGKKEKTVNLSSTLLDVKAGRHQIAIVPIILESKSGDSNFEIQMSLPILTETNFSANIDLKSLGIDPKDIILGQQSKPFSLTYSADPIYDSVPEIVSAATDFDNNVILSLRDKQNADAYIITVKSGKDINYIEFRASDKKHVSKQNTLVTVTLDQTYLKENGIMVPELNEKYSFYVTLKKYALNLVDKRSEETTSHESKSSKAFDYTPFAAWKNAPEITYASQTADGQITLRWEHDDNKLGCEYKIVRYDKILGVKKGEAIVGKTPEKEFIIKDLLNGKYTYVVVPVYDKEEGLASEDVSVELQNNWVLAPSLECSLGKEKEVILKWSSSQGIEKYHVIVSAGSGSLLRFVNLDFNKYKEFDVQAKPGEMEYKFTYEDSIDPELGVKLKFQIYGIRHAADGTEQRSATTSQTIVVK